MSSETAEVDYLQELSSRHDEVVAKLDELEKKITLVLDEYLGKVKAITDEALNDDLEIK
ncbi:MAG: hypothetical protein IJK97_13240 [Thermoguttaceae bacterium]|nr:hypothetical protein [Thermoguttaceae bacterium]MBR0191226.1 hypothetical protein [Thermoguttaceae bacterium]